MQALNEVSLMSVHPQPHLHSTEPVESSQELSQQQHFSVSELQCEGVDPRKKVK